MNILIDASTYSIGNSMGGIGVRLWELAQVLSKNYFITFWLIKNLILSIQILSLKFIKNLIGKN